MTSQIFHSYPVQEFPETLLKASMAFQSFINQLHEEAYKQTEKGRIPSEAGLVARGKAEALHYVVDKFDLNRDLFNRVYALAVVMEQLETQKAFELSGVNVDELIKHLMQGNPDPLGAKFGSPEFRATIKRMESAA